MTGYRCKEVTPAKLGTLFEFVHRNNLTLVYGLNDMFGRPTKTSPETALCSGAPFAAQSVTAQCDRDSTIIVGD